MSQGLWDPRMGLRGTPGWKGGIVPRITHNPRMSEPREVVLRIDAIEATQIVIGLGRLRLWLRGDRSVGLTDADLAALERGAGLVHEMSEQAVASSREDAESGPTLMPPPRAVGCELCQTGRVERARHYASVLGAMLLEWAEGDTPPEADTLLDMSARANAIAHELRRPS